MDKEGAAINRAQNFLIVLLTLSALFLIGNLPLFGALSDQSLIELGRARLQQETAAVQSAGTRSIRLVSPVRIVFSNEFARFGTDTATTLGDEFEQAGTYLGEAIGSAYATAHVRESAFLAALRGPGLYFDLTAELPLELLAAALDVTAPDIDLGSVRRILLCPSDDGQGAVLYLQDGAHACRRFSTAVQSGALSDYLAAQGGAGVEFAFSLGPEYADLSPYTLSFSEPARRERLTASNALTESAANAFLRRAGFNARPENRFIEASGTVIVREVNATLHLQPNGTVFYQGSAAESGSPCFVPSAGETPTFSEAAAAAQQLADTLLGELSGSAALSLTAASAAGDRYEFTFDYLYSGTPIRLSSGAHAAVITIEGHSVTSYVLRVRHYAAAGDSALQLPLLQAAAIAREYPSAELSVVYVDGGSETVSPVWVAD